MAKCLTIGDLKAGHTFYVCTNENTVEAYRVIKRKGRRFAVVSEGGPISGDYLGQILHLVHKFRTRNNAIQAMKLQGIKPKVV